MKSERKIGVRSAALLLMVGIAFLAFQAGDLQAQERIYGFYPITNNAPGNAAAIADQLFVRVFNGAGTAKFEFTNVGSYDSSITEVYFENGTLFGLDEIIDKDNGGDPDVDFVRGASPGNLPGGSGAPYNFTATIEFSVDAESPSPQWGVEAPGQWLQLNFDLLPEDPVLTIQDVFDELDEGNLRIGLHVSSIDGPGGFSSESFINIPEPASMLLLTLGVLPLLRKKKR